MAHGLDLSSVSPKLLLVFCKVLVRIRRQIAKMFDVKFDNVCVGKLNTVVSAVASVSPASNSIQLFIITVLKLFQYYEHSEQL